MVGPRSAWLLVGEMVYTKSLRSRAPDKSRQRPRASHDYGPHKKASCPPRGCFSREPSAQSTCHLWFRCLGSRETDFCAKLGIKAFMLEGRHARSDLDDISKLASQKDSRHEMVTAVTKGVVR